jgi:ABC-type transport system involved in multi-copper enzyme maturation permease subunit
MNRGLIAKTVREIAFPTALAGIGLMLVEALFSYIFWSYQQELTQELIQIDFVRDMIQSLVGANYDAPIGAESFMSLAWVHPLVLAFIFAHVITTNTRIPSGEIDRGTADFLFALPVSRIGIFRVEIVLSFLSILGVLTLAAAGSALGYSFVPPEGRPEPTRVATVIANLYLLAIAVAGITAFASTLTDRRGRAIGWSFGIVLTFLVWNLLAQYSEVVERALVANILYYYRPMPILVEGGIPWRNFLILALLAAVSWTAAAVTLVRRDIATT